MLKPIVLLSSLDFAWEMKKASPAPKTKASNCGSVETGRSPASSRSGSMSPSALGLTPADSAGGADCLSLNPLGSNRISRSLCADRGRWHASDNWNRGHLGPDGFVWDCAKGLGGNWFPDGSDVRSRSGDPGSLGLGVGLGLIPLVLGICGGWDVNGLCLNPSCWLGVDAGASLVVGCARG